jgi:hypothetical protein
VRRTLPHRAPVSIGVFSCFDGWLQLAWVGRAMKRREFITLGSVVAAWPLAALRLGFAQQVQVTVNGKTAQPLGLSLSPILLAQVDEVIE